MYRPLQEEPASDVTPNTVAAPIHGQGSDSIELQDLSQQDGDIECGSEPIAKPSATIVDSPSAADVQASIDALSGFRFLAALSIVAFHFHADAYRLDDPEDNTAMERFLSNTYSLVPFFFLASGFGHTMSSASAVEKKQFKLGRFYFDRFMRLYPLYVLSLVMALAHGRLKYSDAKFHKRFHTRDGAIAFSLLQAWYPSRIFDDNWNGPAWYLSVEVLLLALFPLLVCIAVHFRNWIVAFISGACLYATSVGLGFRCAQDGAGNYCKFFPPTHLPTFVCGIMLAQVCRHCPVAVRRCRGWHLLGPISVAVLVFVLSHTRNFARSGEYPYFYTGTLVPLYATLIASLTFAPRSFLGQALSCLPLKLIAPASYAVYVFQSPFHRVCLAMDVPQFGWYLLMLTLFGIVVHYSIERQVLLWTRRLLHRRAIAA